MIQKYTKTMPSALIPATLTAAVICGMLLKISVVMYPGEMMFLSDGQRIIAGDWILCLAIYPVIFAAAVVVLLVRCRWKGSKELERRDSINKKWRQQRADVVCAVEQLQHEYIEAEQHYVAKSRFLNRMSHDLRTPMNAIMGYSMLLESAAENPDKVTHYAHRIFAAGQSLLELINDVLDMSCIENGNVKLVENEFSLLSALEEIKTSIKPQAESKKQHFSYYLSNCTGTDRIVGDKQRICQILRNILSNAVKYTPEGGNIDMIVNIIEGENGHTQMICNIRDTGCGMSMEFMKTLFQPFEREENEQNVNVQGTGLGMCIARSFTELMNGSISVESEKDSGTQVTVKIPLLPVETSGKIVRHNFSGEGIFQGLRFLAAEDNESNAEILSEVLKAMGAECTIAEHGQAAVKTFEASYPGQYDVILMDIQMPVMNGYQAATAIRRSNHPDAADIKIVAMTADAFEEDVQRAFVSGMNAHVAKPLDLEAFTNTIVSLDLKS